MTPTVSHLVRPLLALGLLALGCDTDTLGRTVVRDAATAPASAAPRTAATAVEVDASDLSIVVHTVKNPPRTGDPKEDYWIQYEVFGEITNHSAQTFEMVSGRLTFHDASGAMLGIESIGTLSQQDAGDFAPGETVYAEVHFVQPGQSVPFHFMRNLAAVDGDIATHRLVPRRGTPADRPPHGLAVGVTERIEEAEFSKKRVFEGSIRNDGEGGCRSPAFVVAILDDHGKIVSIHSHDASDDLHKVLAKGESIPFAAKISVGGDHAPRETAAVKTWVDCQPVY